MPSFCCLRHKMLPNLGKEWTEDTWVRLLCYTWKHTQQTPAPDSVTRKRSQRAFEDLIRFRVQKRGKIQVTISNLGAAKSFKWSAFNFSTSALFNIFLFVIPYSSDWKVEALLAGANATSSVNHRRKLSRGLQTELGHKRCDSTWPLPGRGLCSHQPRARWLW